MDSYQDCGYYNNMNSYGVYDQRPYDRSYSPCSMSSLAGKSHDFIFKSIQEMPY